MQQELGQIIDKMRTTTCLGCAASWPLSLIQSKHCPLGFPQCLTPKSLWYQAIWMRLGAGHAFPQ